MFTFIRRFAWFARELTARELALRALSIGEHADAEQRFSVLIATAATGDERAFLHNKRGVARVHLSRRADARADFQAALDAVGAYAPALTNLGNLAQEDGALDEAVRYYELAIRADDEYALAHQNLGAAYKRMGRYDAGVREMRRAHRLEGRFLGKRRR